MLKYLENILALVSRHFLFGYFLKDFFVYHLAFDRSAMLGYKQHQI